jgi:hypothetical protein
MKRRKVRIGRDAITGRFVSIYTARRRPKTTVVETITRRCGGQSTAADRSTRR